MPRKQKPISRLVSSVTGAFTIIELIIVIIVIGILSTLTIVIFNTYLVQGHTTMLKGDLAGGAQALNAYQQTNHNYPANLSSVSFPTNNGDVLTYTTNTDYTKYCLLVSGYNQSWYILNTNTTPQSGTTCPSLAAMVSTIAGNGTQGYINGVGTAAEFALPSGIAIDSSGNIYVADTFNQRIRKITPDGTVSLFAGNGTQGYVQGSPTTAEFTYPSGNMVLDTSGNLYVADSNTGSIRKIDKSGNVSNLAGNGTWWNYQEGTGTGAEFYWPKGTAIDSNNNVFVADTNNYRVRKVTPGGTTSSYAGNGVGGHVDGAASSAEFSAFFGITVDSAGNVYIADTGNNCIRKITPGGTVSTLAGNGTAGYVDGTATNAEFNNPTGITIDPRGYLYVADTNNNAIRRIAPNGTVTTVAGNGTAGYVDGVGSSAEFYQPYSIAIDGSGNLYIADTYNNRIRKIVP